MKHSAHKIFKNLNSFLFTLALLASVGLLFTIEQNNSYKSADTLKKQKNSVFLILKNLKQSDSIDIFEFNYKFAQLHNEIKELTSKQQYNYISKYLLKNTDEYTSDLNKLAHLLNVFYKSYGEYFELKSNGKKSDPLKDDMQSAYDSISTHIDSVLIKNISYDESRFYIFSRIFFVLTIMIFITAVWYRKRLMHIYYDLLFLQSADAVKNRELLFSQEAESIALKMRRKTGTSSDAETIDQVTGINNNNGMLKSYDEKKSLKGDKYTCVAILEIDNFSKSNRTFSQEFTQEILKKAAYTISLYQQISDTIARTDYNQFTLIFSRESKEQLIKDIELIRQSISEINFSTIENENLNITVTGALIIKPSNLSLEDTIKKVKELLEKGKSTGSNKIYQSQNLHIK